MINALASLLLPIPSLRWLASSFFQTKGKKLAGGGQGIKAGSLVVEEKSMEGGGRSRWDRLRKK
ncbi:hypothetical protein [Paenibacillus polysaccharolyticus]|uniref:hypothetical protein n=1 Tax=Paenibacillus polysaccharolyticus TaxID=582692 RepID=UPI0020403899|nr:hypothetical protein [Paenibacillus polysaccharolyticus]